MNGGCKKKKWMWQANCQGVWIFSVNTLHPTRKSIVCALWVLTTCSSQTHRDQAKPKWSFIFSAGVITLWSQIIPNDYIVNSVITCCIVYPPRLILWGGQSVNVRLTFHAAGGPWSPPIKGSLYEASVCRHSGGQQPTHKGLFTWGACWGWEPKPPVTGRCWSRSSRAVGLKCGSDGGRVCEWFLKGEVFEVYGSSMCVVSELRMQANTQILPHLEMHSLIMQHIHILMFLWSSAADSEKQSDFCNPDPLFAVSALQW